MMLVVSCGQRSVHMVSFVYPNSTARSVCLTKLVKCDMCLCQMVCTQRGDRTHDHTIKSRALYQLS